jgi:hypothetical protein
LAELEAHFDWSRLRVYELNALGQNHGILLAWEQAMGTQGDVDQRASATPVRFDDTGRLFR